MWISNTEIKLIRDKGKWIRRGKIRKEEGNVKWLTKS
jgi:hypothetical protein